jgi:hypothetical protein
MRGILGAVVVAVVLSCLIAGAADVFQTYGLNRQGWTDRFVDVVFNSYFTPYEATARLKAVPASERAAVVTAFGTVAKAFFDTPEFKAAYKKRYEEALPDEQKPPRTKARIEAELRAQMDKSVKEMEDATKGVTGEMKKVAEQAIAQIREQSKQIPMLAEMQAQEEKSRYQEAKNRPPDPDAAPADPKVALRRSLKKFLDVTAGVDYAAATKAAYGHKVFVNGTYERKTAEWKMCYRAGREACEAARAFATSWLAELK